MRAFPALLGCVLLVLSGCGSGGGGGRTAAPPAAGGGGGGGGSTGTPAAVSFAPLAQGQFSTHPLGVASGEVVIRSQTDWQAFFALHNPRATVPALDFATEQVLCAFQGQKPSSGFEVVIQEVMHDPVSDRLEVEVWHRTPAPGSVVARVITEPFHFVTTAKTQGPVAFRRLAQRHPTDLEQGDISYLSYNDPQFQGKVEVFTEETAFLAFWSQHQSGRLPPPAPPRIDFRDEIVIAALQGFRTNGGFGITVTEVQSDGTDRLVVVVEKDEVPGLTSVITNPFHLVSIEKVAFAEVVVRTDEEIPFTTIEQGSSSGHRYGDSTFTGEGLALRDDASLQTIWTAHTSNVFPAPAAPAADFTQETLLFAFHGYASTGGYGISVNRVVRSWQGGAVVHLDRVSPSPTQPVTLAITNPFHFVRVERIDGPVTFR